MSLLENTFAGFNNPPKLPVFRGWSLEEMSLLRQFSVGFCRERIITMATFYSLMSFVSVNGFEYSDPGSFDLIANLPLEIAIIILRTLSGKDLLNVACVSKKWFHVCKSDSKLRQKIRRYLRQQRRAETFSRLFGTGRRNLHGNDSNRPMMMNVVNTVRPTSLQANRIEMETSASRYMPYRRFATFRAPRVGPLTRKNRILKEDNSARFRLRM